MHRFLLFSLVAALCVSAVPFSHAASKIVAANMELVLLAHPKTIQNKTDLQTLAEKLEAESLPAKQAYEKAVEQFRSAEESAREAHNNPILTDLKKREAMDTLQQAAIRARNAENNYRRIVADMENQLRKRKDESVDEVLADIAKATKELAEKNGYDLVLDSSFRRAVIPIPSVVFCSEPLDITDALIAATKGDRATAEKTFEESKKIVDELNARREAALSEKGNEL